MDKKNSLYLKSMSEEQYMEHRVLKQLDWYTKKSRKNQLMYKWLKAAEIIFAGSIPVIALLQIKASAIVSAVLGAMVAMLSALSALNRYHENWTNYRTTAETLKKEMHLYLTGVEPYNKKNKFAVLVNTVEAILTKENSSWLKAAQTKVAVESKNK